MATKTWAGAVTGTAATWTTAANWSPSGAPIATEDVVVTPDATGQLVIPVTVGAIPAIASLSVGDSTSPINNIILGGTNVVGWNIGSGNIPVTVPTAGSTSFIQTGVSGSGKLQKRGAGALAFNNTGLNSGWTGGIDIEAGAVFFDAAATKMGTGAITLFTGTGFSIGGSTAYTIANALVINGTVSTPTAASSIDLNVVGAGALTVSGGVTINSSAATITNTTAVTLSGAITGTAGFTKAGAGDLTLSANNTGLSGAMVVSSGGVYAGSYSATTNVLPNVSSWTISGTGIGFVINTASAPASTFTYDVAVNAAYTNPVTGPHFAIGAFTAAGTASQTFTGTFSGVGAVVVSAPYASVAGATRYSRAKTSSLPGVLAMRVSGSSTAPRFAIYEWGGGTVSTGTNVFLDQIDTAGQATNTLFSIYNSGTAASTVTFNNVTKASNNSVVYNAVAVFGNAADTGNLAIAGVISEGTGIGTLGITKAGPQKLVLSGANTYTGTTAISAGTLSAQSSSSGTKTQLGGSGAVTTSGTGVLDISSTGTDASNLMIVDKATRTLTLGSSGNPQLSSTTGFNQINIGTVTLNTDLLTTVEAGAYLKLNNTAAMTGASRSATKTGDGEFDFGTFANTFSSTSGTVTVSAGTVSFGASVFTGAAGPLGQSSTAIALAGTLKYNGASTASLTRAVALSGSPAFDASGAAAINMTPATLTHSTGGTRTITFKGSSTNDNTFGTAIADNGADVVSLTKTEAGKWIVSGAPSYTGDTTVSGGTLTFDGQTVQQNVVMNGTGVLDNTILAGVKNITCNGGTPEIKANANNTISGTTAITSGSLRVTTEVLSGGQPVKVLGDTDVTVTTTLQTTKGANQRGQMRYGGDLTFSAGSTLRIG